MPWPDGGAWALATTSATVDWQPAAAALAAASTVRVAALVFGSDERPGRLLLDELATFLHAGDGAADPLSVDEAAALVRTLARTHGLVLVVGVPGLLVATGRAGWTLMDLAVAMSAPVVVVTGTGPDAANHTTLALGAVSAHGLAATVITVGGPPSSSGPSAAGGPPSSPGQPAAAGPPPGGSATERAPATDAGPSAAPGPDLGDSAEAAVPAAAPGPDLGDSAEAADPAAATAAEIHPPEPDAPAEGSGPPPTPDHEAGIPLAPAGRIPADAADHAGNLTAAAHQWLHPLLHASAGRPKAEVPPPPPQPLPPPATASGKRVVLLLAGVFVSMSLVVCGLAFCQPTDTLETRVTLEQVTAAPARPGPVPETFVPPTPVPRPTRPVADICPQHQGRITPAAPDRATTKRVNAAWQRIEVWLAERAPASRRSLAPPADARQIDAAQRRMSVAFPADLVASLRRHNGVTNKGSAFTLPFMYSPMPVADIPAEWLSLCEVLGDVFGDGDSNWWDKSFVPFASSLDGGNLLVDQRPGHHGRVGEFFNEEGVSFERWPASVTELLEKTADSLETGRPYGGSFRPTVTKEGFLDWDVV